MNYVILQKMAGLDNPSAAKFLGVNLTTIKRWRNGKAETPKAVIKLLEYKIKFGDL